MPCFCEGWTAYIKAVYVNLGFQKFIVEEKIFELVLFKHSSFIIFRK